MKEYPKLSEDGKHLEGKITAEEATSAQKRMKNGKDQALMDSPSHFLSLLKEETRQSVVRVINDSSDKGEMSPTQKKFHHFQGPK